MTMHLASCRDSECPGCPAPVAPPGVALRSDEPVRAAAHSAIAAFDAYCKGRGASAFETLSEVMDTLSSALAHPTPAAPRVEEMNEETNEGEMEEPTFEDVPAMSREDLEAHYRMAMLNWRNAQQERDELAAARTGPEGKP